MIQVVGHLAGIFSRGRVTFPKSVKLAVSVTPLVIDVIVTQSLAAVAITGKVMQSV
jgi:hypothetical protein